MECGKNGNKLNKLFKSPLTFCTTACSRFQSHSVENSETTHGNTVIAMADFMANMTRRGVPIDQQIDQLIQNRITQNREKIKSIVKTVIFCGQNNIPLRGQRDDKPNDASLQGNFQALLQFRIDSGDTKLKEHLIENVPRNSTYRSKTIQNDIISTVGTYIMSNYNYLQKSKQVDCFLSWQTKQLRQHFLAIVTCSYIAYMFDGSYAQSTVNT